ncbi:RNA-binding protein [Sporosarcina sp. Te-1]|uniref:RNA-binding protein n=1 Tax=Sporosarcina sp. Te-1 TaxID=2818390 RepID=UPI001A9D1AFB|nr:RNA-binding protein [Sporosarcina sp. Te-1]QTD41096.1 hypothetical protein J3U78_20595 [Sporosarcina sp. Te-1]
MKKTVLAGAFMGATLLLGACSDKAPQQSDDQAIQQETAAEKQATPESQGAIDKSDTAKSDEALKEEFSKAKGVSSISLIVTEDSGGYVLVDFEVEDDMTKENAEQLAAAFLNKAEEAYPEDKIDIQARKNGESFVQQTKE